MTSIGSEERRRFEIPDGLSGVVVTNVAPRSFTSRSGLRVGDVIVEINRMRVSTPEDVQRAAEGATGSVFLLVNRQGRSLYLAWR